MSKDNACPDREAFLARVSNDYGPIITARAGERFDLYWEELLFWNRKINLVSARDAEEIWSRHFPDSLSLAPFLGNNRSRVIDLGAGAGFPALPLKIVFPDLDVYLVESSRKKASFLKGLIRKLGLPGARVINERVEALTGREEFRHTFDLVISRAAFKLPGLIKMAACFLKANGLLLALKGPKVFGGELADAEFIAPAVGLAFLFAHPVKGDKQTSRTIILGYKRYGNQ